MTLKELDVENEYTKNLPQYIRQYKCFYKFMRLLSNYIIKSVEYGKKILELMKLETSTGDVLVKLAKRVDVVYDRAYLGTTEEDAKLYYNNLKTGIYGMQSKRLSTGTLQELENNLSTVIPGITKLVIKDNMDMSVNIDVVGSITELDSDTIEKYIIPKVTGVKFNITYVPYGKDLFAFDTEKDIIDKDTGDKLYGLRGWDEGSWAPSSTTN